MGGAVTGTGTGAGVGGAGALGTVVVGGRTETVGAGVLGDGPTDWPRVVPVCEAVVGTEGARDVEGVGVGVGVGAERCTTTTGVSKSRAATPAMSRPNPVQPIGERSFVRCTLPRLPRYKPNCLCKRAALGEV